MKQDRKPAHRVGARKPQRKEVYYVRVAVGDGDSAFFPATEHIGRQMPFQKPRELAAVRMYPDVVTISLVHLTKRGISEARERPVEMPHGQLSRLARTAGELELEAGKLVAVGSDGTVRRYNMVRDANNVVTLEADENIAPDQLRVTEEPTAEPAAETDGDEENEKVEETAPAKGPRSWARYAQPVDVADEPSFELSPRGERLSLYMLSPISGKKIALSYSGHLGRPGAYETLARCAAKVIHASLALGEVRLLSNIEDIEIPSGMGARVQPAAMHMPASVTVPVALFDESFANVANGNIQIDIDLTHAPVGADRLFFTVTPDSDIAEHFNRYRTVADKYVTDQLRTLLGDEIRSIVYEIVLGEVEPSTVERLTETLKVMPAVWFAPEQYRYPPTAPDQAV